MASTSGNYEILLRARLDTSLVQSQINKLGTTASGAGAPINNIYTTLTKFSGTISSIRMVAYMFENLTESVFTLDKALTEYKRVSDLTNDSLDAFIEKAGEIGEVTARTASEMIEASTQFKRAGFTDDDALMLSEIATLYQNVADTEVSASDSAGLLISQMKAFNIEAEDSIRIIDSINEVAKRYAVSSSDVSSALTKTSSAFAVLGNSYEESIGLVTAG